MFQLLLAQNQDFFIGDRREYVYDCMLVLYTMRQLMPAGEKREFVLNIENLVGQRSEFESFREGMEG